MVRPKMIRRRVLGPLALTAVATLAVGACSGGGGASGGSGGTVVLGATLSLSGALGVLGTPVKAGYDQAVSDINAAGGITVNGAKEKVKLVVLDNASDPNKASSQARELVLKDNAVALLGFTTPPIVTPTALAAEQLKIPFVTSLTPVEAFASGDTSGWKYSWDFFFDEKSQAEQAAKALAAVASNKKAVVFTDNEPDGVLERPLYKAALKAAGVDVVGDYTFPVGTTDFSSFIANAKAQGAQLLAAQMTPADGVALWKQLKSFNFAPQAAFVAKASDATYWWQTLGTMAQDTLSEGFWSATGVQSAQLGKVSGTLGKTFGIDSGNMGAATMAYTAAEILAQAIGRAGSTDPDKINDAIGQTDGNFPGGHVQFSPTSHTWITPYYITQWQSGQLVQVMPPVSGVTFAHPTAGLG